MPRVSVITRTKNRPLLLERAWKESLSIQKMKSFEWIIINDGGEPEAIERIASEARGSVPVKVIHHKESKGMEAASNAGISAVETPYILIHDDDDTLNPGYLSATVNYLDEHPEKDGVFTHIIQIYEKIRKGEIDKIRSHEYTAAVTAIYLADFLGYNPFVPISFTYRRTLHDSIGLYDENLPVVGDWDFFIRAIRHSDMGLIPEALANYHIRLNGKRDDRNSITEKSALHAEYDAAIRNKYLREDLSAGRYGLGVMMNQSYRDHFIRSVLMRLNKVFNILVKIRDLFKIR